MKCSMDRGIFSIGRNVQGAQEPQVSVSSGDTQSHVNKRKRSSGTGALEGGWCLRRGAGDLTM